MSIASEEDFAASTAPLRAELVAYCYRMLGSPHEAEDLVQETLLRAWRARERFDGQRATPRTWLYAIATNACLSALAGRARRPLPTGLGGPSDDPEQPLVPSLDVPWLHPLPADPESEVARRGTLRLALIAAMQLLPPRQRAVLILRDVLQFSAADVAGLLDTSVAAVNSALQRARAGLGGVPVVEETVSGTAETARIVEKYVSAFEAADVAALVALLTDDAVLEMPPVPLWYAGRDDYGRFLSRVFTMRGTDWRLRQTVANGQPALVAYCREDTGPYRLHTLQVLTIGAAGVSHNVVYQDPRVFEAFGLTATI